MTVLYTVLLLELHDDLQPNLTTYKLQLMRKTRDYS